MKICVFHSWQWTGVASGPNGTVDRYVCETCGREKEERRDG